MPTRAGLVRKDYPNISRGVMFDTVNGKLRIRSWPNPRGLNLHPHTEYMNDWFRDAAFKIKRIDARMVAKAMQLAAGTGLYPRDVLMKAGSSPFYTIALPDGSHVQPRKLGIWQVSFQGIALSLKDDTQNISNSFAPVIWDQVDIDTIPLYDVLNPEYITIPAGINIINVTVSYSDDDGGNYNRQIQLLKNGNLIRYIGASGTTSSMGPVLVSGPISVTAGDTIQPVFRELTNTAKLVGSLTHFSIEVLDASIPVT